MEAAAGTAVDGLIARQQRFAELANRKDALERELAEIKAEQAGLEDIILEGMVAIEQPNTRMAGRTLYVHRQLWASAPKEEGAAALIAVGLGDEYVSNGFNTNSVSKLFREWDQQEQDKVLTPEDAELRQRLLATFSVAEKFSLRATK